MFENISNQIGTYLPSILSAIAVLVIGWLIAHIVAKLVRAGLERSGLGYRIGRLLSSEVTVDAGKIISQIVFYLLMIFVLITFFNVLNLPIVSEPLNRFLGQIFEYAPRILSAAGLGVVAYVLARLLKEVTKRGLDAIQIDQRLASLGMPTDSAAAGGSPETSKQTRNLATETVSQFVAPEPDSQIKTRTPMEETVVQDGPVMSRSIDDEIDDEFNLDDLEEPILNKKDDSVGDPDPNDPFAHKPNINFPRSADKSEVNTDAKSQSRFKGDPDFDSPSPDASATNSNSGGTSTATRKMPKAARGPVSRTSTSPQPAGKRQLSSATASRRSTQESVQLSKSIPEAVYWLVFALFLPAILGALQMPGLLEPVQAMFTKALNYVPNILGAVLILVVGLFVARIVKQVVSNLTASLGVNTLASRFGLGDALSQRKISDVLGVLAYAMVLLPILVAALNTLDIEAVTQPASSVLHKITSLIPGFLGAAIVLCIAYFVGKVVANVAEDLLSGIGFDSVPAKIGLRLTNSADSNNAKSVTENNSSPSKLASKLILAAIVLLSVLQALPMMGLDHLAVHVMMFVTFATRMLLGLGILAIGMYLANFAAGLIKDSKMENAKQLALVARIAIIVFAGGFALQQIGLSASIINVAFASLLGGIGLAMAIAFGWGGRDAAKRVLDRLVK